MQHGFAETGHGSFRCLDAFELEHVIDGEVGSAHAPELEDELAVRQESTETLGPAGCKSLEQVRNWNI